MDDVGRLIMEAWDRLGPGIVANPEELARRVARRRSALLTRPPRAWCIALRASDRRITPAHWIIYPEHAMELSHEEHPYEPIEHEVTIDARVLRKYCRPVNTDSWGENVDEVSRWLGVNTASGLTRARRHGVFSERKIKGLGGRRGKPVPLIHTWERLDPSGPGYFSRPDKLWGCLWEYLPDMVPDDFQQTIVRRPVFQWMGDRKHRPTKADPFRSGRGLRPPEIYREEMQLIGWRWVCPGCRKEVRKIYYPIQPRSLFDVFRIDPALGDVERLEALPGSFACTRCDGIHSWSRADERGWNQVVSFLTRGMLYGREVERPGWYKPERKRARHRQMRSRPAVKREGVFVRMMNGWTLERIAVDMKMSKNAVVIAMGVICRQEGVKNRRELAAKLGWKHEQPLNARERSMEHWHERADSVEAFLMEGWSYKEIAQRLGLKVDGVKAAAGQVYKRRGVRGKGRKGLIELHRLSSSGQNKESEHAVDISAAGGGL